MAKRDATISSLSDAFDLVAAMQAEASDWDNLTGKPGAHVVERVIEDQMTRADDEYLATLDAYDNGDQPTHHLRRWNRCPQPACRPLDRGTPRRYSRRSF